MHSEKEQDKEHVLSKRLSKILEARYENDPVIFFLIHQFPFFIKLLYVGYP